MRIGVTLTSSLNVGNEYIELTRELSSMLAKQNHGIVYGGTDYGMMSELATTYKSNGGKDLVGVMAEDLIKVTKGYKAFSGLDEKHLLPTMEDRKRKIVELSEGFIILPGGYGTIEELGTIVGGKANKLFDKPIVLYNYKGFYDKFIDFLRSMTSKSFSKVSIESIVHENDNTKDILDYLVNYQPTFVPDKFVD
jgi:uncharacterized protein (TIGR00730 family)